MPEVEGDDTHPAAKGKRAKARKLPTGASSWSKQYYIEKIDRHGKKTNKLHMADKPVPVDKGGVLAGREYQCPKCEESQWHPLSLVFPPACELHSMGMLPCDGTPVPGMPDTDRFGWMFPQIPWAQMWDWGRERLLIAGGTVGIGTLGYTLDQSAMPFYGHGVQVAAEVVFVAAAWGATRKALELRGYKPHGKRPPRLNRDDPEQGKGYMGLVRKRARGALYAALGLAGWVEFCDILGVAAQPLDDWRGWVLGGVLATVSTIATRPFVKWRDAERARRSTITPEPEKIPVRAPTTPTDSDGRRRAQEWKQWVVAEGKKLPNTVAVAERHRPVVGGWAITLRGLTPGALSVDMFHGDNSKALIRTVSQTYNVRPDALNFLPSDRGHVREVEMLVQPDPPLAKSQHIRGLDDLQSRIRVADGVFVNGTYVDGSAMTEPLMKKGWGARSKIVFGTTGSGKALALDTPIPTPTGWITMGEVRPGGQVFDENGRPCNVVAATPVMHGRPCYEVEFSDGTVIVADAEHQWRTSTQRGRWQQANLRRHPAESSTRRANVEMLDTEPVTTEQIAATLHARRSGSQPDGINHAVPVCGPLEYPKRDDLTIEPYTLGAWLGDGRTDDSGITSADPEVLDRIRQDGYEVTATSGSMAYRITNNAERKRRVDQALDLAAQGVALYRAAKHVGISKDDANKAAGGAYPPWRTKGAGIPADVPALPMYRTVRGLLTQLGVLGNKHIPERYLRASIEQRSALLAGLLDTDGTCTKAGTVEYTSTSSTLAGDVMGLVLGLGYKANIRSKAVHGRTPDSSVAYTISFTTDDPVFRLPRKTARQRAQSPQSTARRRYIVDVRPVASVPVRCIEVDSSSHMYLASRACIPTHNSEDIRQQMVVENWAGVEDPKTGLIVPMYATFLQDFKRFESFGEFRRRVHAAGCTRQDAYVMLGALIDEMDRRYDLIGDAEWVDEHGRARDGGIKYDPLTHGPILSWVIDEFHEIAKDQVFMGLIELLSRKMRACGIRITVGTHLGTLSDMGNRGFRDMLSGGYAVYGRTTDGLTQSVTGSGAMAGDPRSLPKIPGMCYVGDGDQATRLGRRSYIPGYEDAKKLRVPEVYDYLVDLEGNPIGYQRELPTETLDAFGVEWQEWAAAGKGKGKRPLVGSWTPIAMKLMGEKVEVIDLAMSGGQAVHRRTGTAGDAAAEPTPVETADAEEIILSILLDAKEPLGLNEIDAELRPRRSQGLKCGARTMRNVLKKLIEDGLVVQPTGHGRGGHLATDKARAARASAAAPSSTPSAAQRAGRPGGPLPEGADPEMITQAVELIVTSQFGSLSMLQRKMRIGFALACQVMDYLHERGIVGPDSNGAARQVLVKPDDLQAVLDRMEAAQ
jgi:hypothetical protein